MPRRESAGAVDRPASEEHLPARVRQSREDVGVQRESGRSGRVCLCGSATRRKLPFWMYCLRTGQSRSIGEATGSLDEAGPVRVLVAMDQADELRAHTVGGIGAGHHAQRVAGFDRELVGVGGDADVGHRSLRSSSALTDSIRPCTRLRKTPCSASSGVREHLVVDDARRHAPAAGEGDDAVFRERLDREDRIFVGRPRRGGNRSARAPARRCAACPRWCGAPR